MSEEKKKSKVPPAKVPPVEKAKNKQQPDAAAADKQIQETSQAQPAEKKNPSQFQELRSDIPEIRPGDELKIYYRVIEAGKERIQIYEGTVISIKNSGISKTITVRKNSFGIAVERIFPLNSKLVQKIEVKKHTKVRRAKLYYLRKLKGKASRLKELR
jgi:large subunit ribosomal protein L19